VNDQTPVAAQTDMLHGRYQALLEISEAIASHRELDQLFRDLAPRLHRVVEFDFVNLLLYHAEREHITRTLREGEWIVGGSNGAASRLGMKRTTLQSGSRNSE
jgi:transcriptional regulator with GAF, ATPase, and Fis domain